MAERLAVCPICGAEKDLPLGRCAACGDLPQGEGRLLAIVCSTRVLDLAALREAQTRIRRGEPVRPTRALLDQARAVLAGAGAAPVQLGARELVLLVLGNLLVTPFLGYAIWWRWRDRPGPGARQALIATVPASIVLFVAILAWRVVV